MPNKLLSKKSFKFAKRIIKLNKYLTNQDENIISKQILRSGTSIGANIAEGEFAQSRNDLISKYYIALKEASETRYWLQLLEEDYIKRENLLGLLEDIEELIKLLVTSIKKLKERI
jgi:four helix bundle protein